MWLGRMYFIRVFTSILNSLTLDKNKGSSWISSGISWEKIKPFDTDLAQTMTN